MIQVFPHCNIQMYASRVLVSEKQQHTQRRKAKSLYVNTECPIEKSKIPLAFCWRRQKTKLFLGTEAGISSNTTLYLSDSQIPLDVLLKGTFHCRYWVESHRISTNCSALMFPGKVNNLHTRELFTACRLWKNLFRGNAKIAYWN